MLLVMTVYEERVVAVAATKRVGAAQVHK